MWYFTWILGVLLACSLGIINVMWYEFHTDSYEKSNTLDSDNSKTADESTLASSSITVKK